MTMFRLVFMLVLIAPAFVLAAPLSLLEVKGQKFRNVTLSKVETDSASVFHDDGIATFPLSDLSKAQIAALNKTSPTVRIPDTSGRGHHECGNRLRSTVIR